MVILNDPCTIGSLLKMLPSTSSNGKKLSDQVTGLVHPRHPMCPNLYVMPKCPVATPCPGKVATPPRLDVSDVSGWCLKTTIKADVTGLFCPKRVELK